MAEKPKIACADCGRETTTTTRVFANEATIHHICGRCLKKERWEGALLADSPLGVAQAKKRAKA